MIEILLVISTLAGPVLAVQAQKWIERATERRRRKQWIFETLMATRASRLAPEHVRALNQIELEFRGSNWFDLYQSQSAKERTVVDRWREYADILNENTPDDDVEALRRWSDRSTEAFITLLQAIGAALGRHYDRVQLRRGIYYPRAFSEAEQRQDFLQQALARVLVGTQPLSMKVTSFPQPTDEAAAKQNQMQERIINSFSEDGRLRIELVVTPPATIPREPNRS